MHNHACFFTLRSKGKTLIVVLRTEPIVKERMIEHAFLGLTTYEMQIRYKHHNNYDTVVYLLLLMSKELQGLSLPQNDYSSIDPITDDDNEAQRNNKQKETTLMSTAVEAILHQPRLDALLDCDANLLSYDPFSFRMIFAVKGRNFGMICAPLFCLLLWDICWAYILEEELSHTASVFVTSMNDFISPLLTPVSFLLVFRLARSAVRYWDSRAAFGKLVEICRVLMSTAAVSCQHQQRPVMCTEFARWICAFPIATKNFLRPELPCGKDILAQSRRREIGPLLSERDTKDLLTPVKGGGSMEFIAPIHVLDRLRELAYLLSFDDSDDTKKNNNHHQTGIAIYRQLNGQLDTLCGAWGAMERIAATPLPFVYVVHLRTFLVVYLFLWNLQGIGSNGWKTLPALLAASWALLGIEAAAVECERPYQLHANHLSLGKMCVVVAKNVAQTLNTVGCGTN